MATFSSGSDTLQLTSTERANILRLLERRSCGVSTPSQRRMERHSYEPSLAPLIEINGPAGEPGQAFVVIGRNLSEGGLAFLHGGPLAIGAPCSVTLFDKEGTPEVVHARIVRCRKVAGRIHELGIGFTGKIEVGRFTGPCKPGAPDAQPESGLQDSPAEATISSLSTAVARLRALSNDGWPGDSVRTVLAEIEMLAAMAMKSVPDAGKATDTE